VSLTVELEQIAAAASEHGDVTGVLAAEPTPGRRRYLVSLGDDEARRWLAFDDEARPLERRESVRETASIVALCELATDVAAGGDVAELRAQLAQLRMTEQPAGIEEAEEAALALERAIGAPPRVASPAYLDEVGAATRGLERALGELASPFTNAMRSGTGAVDEFVREVESRYVFSLRDSA
jgi:hypothetical protein